jgi:protein-disulfide isomerase
MVDAISLSSRTALASGFGRQGQSMVRQSTGRDILAPIARRRSAIGCGSDMRGRRLLVWLAGGAMLGWTMPAGSPASVGAAGSSPQIAENAAPVLYDGDMMLGSPDALVTIIEYASLTCPHCAHFSTATFPKVKSELIESGKVRWVYRDLPLDRHALSAALLAHCMPKEKFFPTIEALFATQDDWTEAVDVTVALSQIGRNAGLDPSSIDQCVHDRAMIDKIVARIEDSEKLYNVKAVPTFIIDGKTYTGNKDYDEFFGLVKDLLPKP